MRRSETVGPAIGVRMERVTWMVVWGAYQNAMFELLRGTGSKLNSGYRRFRNINDRKKVEVRWAEKGMLEALTS